MTFQQFKKVLAFYGRFTASFTQVGYRWRSLSWPRFVPDFQGQRWLVTGASGGLGGYIALAAARAGAEVVAVARNPAKLAALQSAAGSAAQRVTTEADGSYAVESDPPHREYLTTFISNRARQWIEDSRSSGEPYLAFVTHSASHTPIQPPPPSLSTPEPGEPDDLQCPLQTPGHD